MNTSTTNQKPTDSWLTKSISTLSHAHVKDSYNLGVVVCKPTSRSVNVLNVFCGVLRDSPYLLTTMNSFYYFFHQEGLNVFPRFTKQIAFVK